MCLCLFVLSAAGRAYILEHGVASRSDTNTKLSSAIGKNWHECRNVLSLGRCRMHRYTVHTHTHTSGASAHHYRDIFGRLFSSSTASSSSSSSSLSLSSCEASRFHSIPNESKIGIRSQLVCVPARMWCARPGSACSAFEFVLV